MRLNTIKIRNFRKLNHVEMKFSEATFLIGANNSGKSSMLDAIIHRREVMPEEVKKSIRSKYQIIKATGKATMISFIKYLKALGVDLFVVHDEDSRTPGAVVMNAPILQALDNNETKRLMMHNCIEDELGYPAPSSDKPFMAYQYVKGWNTWDDVPENWREKMKIVFHEYSEQL